MKNFVTGVVAIILLTFFGCLKKGIPGGDKPPKPATPKFTFTPSKNQVVTPVTGKWRWVWTYAGEGGLYTPTSTHSTRVIEFDADSTVKEISNDTLVQHQNYTYITDYKFADSTSSPAVMFGQTYYQCFIKNDTLNVNLIGVIDPVLSKYVQAN